MSVLIFGGTVEQFAERIFKCDNQEPPFIQVFEPE